MRRARSGWSSVAVLALVACLPEPASAQRTTFRPVITLGAFYIDNVFYVDPEEAGGRDTSSTGVLVSVALPLDVKMKRSELSLVYVPRFESFSDFSDLDNLSHRLYLGLNYRPNARRGLVLTSRYVSSADQADPESVEESPLFLTRRVRRDGGTVDLAFTQQLRSRFGLRMGLGASSWSFEEISGVRQGPPGSQIEDRTDLGASFGLARSFKRGHSLGFSYRYRRFDLDVSGQQDVHGLSLTYGVEIGERSQTSFSMGCFWREGEESGSNCNLQGTLRLDRTIGRLWLSLAATHVPSSGDVGLGTSTNSVVALSLGGDQLTWWNWGLWTRYARRDPDNPGQPKLDTVSVGGSIGRSFSRVVGLRLTGSFADQTSDTGAQEGSYYRVGIGVVLHPLGRARLGRGAGP